MATTTRSRITLSSAAQRMRSSTTMFRTAGNKLVVWNVAVMTGILCASGLFIYALYNSHVYSDVDHRLETQRDQALALIQQNQDVYAAMQNNSPYDTNSRTVIVDPSGLNVVWTTECQSIFQFQCQRGTNRPTDRDALQVVQRSGKDDLRTTGFDGEPQRVLTFLVYGSVSGAPAIVQISRNVSGQEMSLHKLALLLALTAFLGAGLSGLGSLFLANRALIPIRKAFSRQRQFTADASHELRTPLALIRANAEMLSRSGGDMTPEDAELVHDIIQETDRLNRLVGDLLTLARADSDQVQLTVRPVDLRAIVADVHEDVQRIAESRGIESSISLDGPVTVQGDQGRLRQLLLILLDNALKYTDPGGRVDISLSTKDRCAHLVVSDTGIGIPVTDLPHIFERFYRVDRARERESGGTGLGLSIARWISHAHGGTIKVESGVGKGTLFTVDIPSAH